MLKKTINPSCLHCCGPPSPPIQERFVSYLEDAISATEAEAANMTLIELMDTKKDIVRHRPTMKHSRLKVDEKKPCQDNSDLMTRLGLAI